MIGEAVEYSLTLIGSHIIVSLSLFLSLIISLFLLLSPSMSLWQCVFSGNTDNLMTLDAESLAYTI